MCRNRGTLLGSCVSHSRWRPEPAEIWISHNLVYVCVCVYVFARTYCLSTFTLGRLVCKEAPKQWRLSSGQDGWLDVQMFVYISGVSSLRVQGRIVFNPSIIHGCRSNVSYVSGILSFCAEKLLQEGQLVELLSPS